MKQHFVMSDIHGMGELFDEVMNYLESQKEGYELIFLGDACDRGPDGYRIMKELLRNPNVIYLKGNHEDLFVKACWEFRAMMIDEHMTSQQLIECYGGLQSLMYNYGDAMALYAGNGGFPTFRAWINDGMPATIVNQLKDLPLTYSYEYYDMCHAGSLSYYFDTKNEHELLWNRRHFVCPWKEHRILIHGHTPVQHLFSKCRDYEPVDVKYKPEKLRPIFYNGKIDMDTGAFKTETIYLYNLDTGDMIGISAHDEIPSFDF